MPCKTDAAGFPLGAAKPEEPLSLPPARGIVPWGTNEEQLIYVYQLGVLICASDANMVGVYYSELDDLIFKLMTLREVNNGQHDK